MSAAVPLTEASLIQAIATATAAIVGALLAARSARAARQANRVSEYVRTDPQASVWMINPITGLRREVTTAEWNAAKLRGAAKFVATVTDEQLAAVQRG